MAEKTDPHQTPFRRLLSLMTEDRQDLTVLVLYTALSGLLSLIVPLTAQALVNTIAAGVFLQPLVILTLILLVVLLFVGALRVAQFYLVEILQRRFFAKVALNLGERVPKIQYKSWMQEYLPEILNRFFDVANVQKALAKILLIGPAAILQIIVGLLLMAVYSPVLLGFDLFIIGFIIFVAFLLGRNSVTTSIAESVEKYRVAGWLEEMARCQTGFKIEGQPGYFTHKTDAKVVDYLDARKDHFRILFAQTIALNLFLAIANAGILGIGGWLVIHRQLTLGQLVASELVMIILLSALEKLVSLFQEWYDLLTGLDKIGHITDLPLERRTGKPLVYTEEGIQIDCYNLTYAYSDHQVVLNDISFTIPRGQLISIVGASGSGKSTLAAILCGLTEPQSGSLELNGQDIREVELQSLRNKVALVSDHNEVFDETLEENLLMGRHHLSPEDITRAVRLTRLTDKVRQMPDGLQTRLLSMGDNLSRGQRQKLMLARAILGKPQLLILYEAFTGIDENEKFTILNDLLDPAHGWTVINISHDVEVIRRSRHVIALENGVIAEQGSPQSLIQSPHSVLNSLCPSLTLYAPGGYGHEV